MALTSKASDPSLPTKVDITSNKSGETTSIVNGFVELRYYESILQDSIKANYIFSDTGNAIDGQSVVEGLPLVGTEDVEIKMIDNNENELKLDLNVNKVTPIVELSTKNVISIQLVSEEYIKNEEGGMRLIERYDGRISDHIKKILKGGDEGGQTKNQSRSFKTKKEVDIEETGNEYNFIGNGRKPFYILNYLSKYSVPEGNVENVSTENNPKSAGSNKTAGFLFFETADGYKFKSIDALFKQEQKKSFVYTESTDGDKGVPAGYDGKVLELVTNNGANAQEKMMMGAYGTKLVVFNPFNCFYNVIEQTAVEGDNNEAVGIELAGRELPKYNDKFENKSTRTTYYLMDTGSLPAGSTEKQIEANTAQNLDSVKIVNQAIRRYNQLFSGMMEITIAGDFSLHAGDVIFVDIPPVTASQDDTVNKQSGGLYIIADLCHLVNMDGTWTKLNLARDSFGRKGNHSTRQEAL
tara:strand:- start:310 stop:1710 length:1401 start_codon:yes stop_codon:yes gene_type:complete